MTDINKRRAYLRSYYLRHREKCLKRSREYNKTEAGKKSIKVRAIRQREKYPEKRKAQQMVRNHIYMGKMKKSPCAVCGEIKVQAHHEDYSKPLEVIWLCFMHHREKHGTILKQFMINPN